MLMFSSTETLGRWTGDGAVIALFSSPKAAGAKESPIASLTTELQELDHTRFGGLVQSLITEMEFKADAGSTLEGRIGDGPVRRVLVVGMGLADKVTLEQWRKGAALAVRWAERVRCPQIALAFPRYASDDAMTAQALTEGALLAAHQDKRFKSDTKPTVLESVALLDLGSEVAIAAVAAGQSLVGGVTLARELVSAPANVVIPQTLADEAISLAQSHPRVLQATVLEQEQCQELGMGLFLGVARASELPPKFIHLTYTPEHSEITHKVAIVGKGLTFDSGGLNLKVGAGSSIEIMKMDMGGAAATLGAARAIAQIQPPHVQVHFIIATCENMISGRAMHPGDILTAANGKTIEVNNTDAEGRLTLADALVYADKLEVEAIVELSTLTGACIVALGDAIAGLWSTTDTLRQQLESAASATGEKFWPMPLEESYLDQLKSIIADYKNTGTRSGGAITGALFLKQFVEKTPAYAHLDIAGPVWTEKESGYNNPGGTGFPVRTLVQWVRAIAGS
ncbi:MAG: leucyl aminopeptidase [Oscillatoriales cyanobacterium SM2_2_1]|nr:leucyl aminopeptidase [Oscillatoriales cyanobacterium SM2_2_1]